MRPVSCISTLDMSIPLTDTHSTFGVWKISVSSALSLFMSIPLNYTHSTFGVCKISVSSASSLGMIIPLTDIPYIQHLLCARYLCQVPYIWP
jgi:hypothetical protein